MPRTYVLLIIVSLFFNFTVFAHENNSCQYNCPKLGAAYYKTTGAISSYLEKGFGVNLFYTPQFAFKSLNNYFLNNSNVFLSKISFALEFNYLHFTGKKNSRRSHYLGPNLNIVYSNFFGIDSLRFSTSVGPGYLKSEKQNVSSGEIDTLIKFNFSYQYTKNNFSIEAGPTAGRILNKNFPINFYGVFTHMGYQF